MCCLVGIGATGGGVCGIGCWCVFVMRGGCCWAGCGCLGCVNFVVFARVKGGGMRRITFVCAIGAGLTLIKGAI